MLQKSCFSAIRNMINTDICRNVCFGHAPWPFKSCLCGRSERVKALRSAEGETEVGELWTTTQPPWALHTSSHHAKTESKWVMFIAPRGSCRCRDGAQQPGTRKAAAISCREKATSCFWQQPFLIPILLMQELPFQLLFLLRIIFSQSFQLSVWMGTRLSQADHLNRATFSLAQQTIRSSQTIKWSSPKQSDLVLKKKKSFPWIVERKIRAKR